MIDWVLGALAGLWHWMLELLLEPWVLVPAVFALVKATGITVQTGTTGLLFSFGRARGIVAPGFRLLLPFLQVVRVVPTRSRTINLPAQRVTTFDGLVFEVDANLVFRIDDVKKALVEVDDLAKGMRQMLGLSVQEVLRRRERSLMRASTDLDESLGRAMAERLAPWGVVIERAGFTSIRPSAETLRLTQLGARAEARRTALARLRAAGLPSGFALPLIGVPRPLVRRAVRAREREATAARRRRIGRAARQTLTRSQVTSAPARRRLRQRALEVLADRRIGLDP